MNNIRKKILLFFFYIFYLCNFAFANETEIEKTVELWFQENPQAAKYRNIKNNLVEILTDAESLSIPLDLLFERLKEGIVKNVPKEKIINTLHNEVAQLKELIMFIQKIDICFQDQQPLTPESNYDIIKQLTIFLRTGLSLKVQFQIFDYACEHKRDLSAILQVFGALIKIPVVSTLSDDELILLGNALLASKLEPENYSALASIFLKGRINRINYSAITDIIVNTLNQGKGLIQIEQQIQRLGGRR